MGDMKISGTEWLHELSQMSGDKKPAGKGFEKIMHEAIGKITQIQDEAEKAVKELVSGGDISHAVIAMEKADMSFQLMVELRNRLLSAYDEVMRMQV